MVDRHITRDSSNEGSHCKYYKQQRYVSYDEGGSWEPLEEYQKGELYEEDSADCGYVPQPSFEFKEYATECYNGSKYSKKKLGYTMDGEWHDIEESYESISLLDANSDECGYMEKWVESGTICDGLSAYTREVKMVSRDSGNTYYSVGEYRKGQFKRAPTADCVKLFAIDFMNGENHVPCLNSDTSTLVQADVTNDIVASGRTGGCCSGIGDCTFMSHTALKHITIANPCGYVGLQAFQWCPNLSSVTFEGGSLSYIEPLAFSGCTNLSSVTFDENSNIHNIYMGAFGDCTSLKEVSLPDSVIWLGYLLIAEEKNYVSGVFEGCTSLESVKFPPTLYKGLTDTYNLYSGYGVQIRTCHGCTSLKHVTWPTMEVPWEIDVAAFANCGFETLSIPSWVAFIRAGAFTGCISLTELTFLEGGADTLELDEAFSGCTSLSEVAFPKGKTLTLRDNTFFGCDSLKNLDFSGLASLTAHGNVFPRGLEQMSFPTNYTLNWDMNELVTTSASTLTINFNGPIEPTYYYGYGDNIQLVVPPSDYEQSIANLSNESTLNKEVSINHVIPRGDISGDTLAFHGTDTYGLKVVGYKGINEDVLAPLNVVDITFTTAGYDEAGNPPSANFKGSTNLNSVTFEEGLVTLPVMLQSSSVRTVSLPEGLESIASSGFTYCRQLTAMTLPNSVTSIGIECFYGCTRLTDVEIGDKVSSIPDRCFASCSSISSVTIGSGVTYIGGDVFQDTSTMESLTIRATTPPRLGNRLFSGASKIPTIYVPPQSVDAYKAADGWSEYSSQIQPIQ